MKLISLIFLLFISFIPLSQADDAKTLHQIYKTTADEYLEPISIEKIACLSLKGLHNIDKNIRIADDENRVSVYYGTSFVQGIIKPKDTNDIDAWVKLSIDVMNAAKKASPVVDKRDFEMIDNMMTYSFQELDTDSKYYADLDIDKKKMPKAKRYFYDRKIGDILYIKVGAFNPYTKTNIVESLNKHPDLKGLILDLRGSPGGMLSEAVDIASLFLDEGIVASTRGRGVDSTKFYNAEAGDIINAKPLVILIDGSTASSAEVLTSSLQEQGRAKVVGTQSFGKGTVQKLIRFDNDSELALSNAYFYTPSGNKIDKVGITPDLCMVGILEISPINKLISRIDQHYPCHKESRENFNIDIDVAVAIINNK